MTPNRLLKPGKLKENGRVLAGPPTIKIPTFKKDSKTCVIVNCVCMYLILTLTTLFSSFPYLYLV